MNNILDLFKRDKLVNQIINETKGSSYSLFSNGLTMNHKALLASSIYNTNKKFLLYICANSYQASKIYDTICSINGYGNVSLYITDDFMATEAVVVNNEFKQERLNTLKNIVLENSSIIVTHVSAVLKPLLSYETFKTNCFSIKCGEFINIESVVKKLIKIGYVRKHTTYNIGEFSVRGEILDIFPSCSEKPYRINIGFDEIEKIKCFELESQLTIGENLNDLFVMPMEEIVINEEIRDIKERIFKIERNEYIEEDFNIIIENNILDKLGKYIHYFDEKNDSLIEYLCKNENCIVIYDEINEIVKSYEALNYEINEYILNKVHNKKVEITFCKPLTTIDICVKRKVYVGISKKGLTNIPLVSMTEFDGYKVSDYQNDLKMFIKDVKEFDSKTFLAFNNNSELGLIKELFDENEVKYNVLDDFFHVDNSIIDLIVCPNAIGYGYFSSYKVITGNEIFKSSKTKVGHYRSVTENTISINNKDDIVPGEYVVHYDYGIGRYLGIKTKETNGVTNDYLQLQYSNMNLLIPVEKISELEKYLGPEGVVPKLTSIGTSEWEKRKKLVRNQLENIAKDLIELQIKRQSIRGHKYQEDSEFQKMFEEDFEYEETRDQIEIVKEIKKEMEEGKLVDRLVCGDVGFGKTEIAMRIAFKTVFEGKQVSYMAPTTILTRQHYHTFKERFERYGIKVALLNRLIEPRIQKEIIRSLKDGSIDIVIGTHRLLNDEIQYNDLGLLIIDEEQRFGVVHKEKIKRIKDQINVITLTATPIPRTLQMAVTGIRSLSLLETPPKNRYPIQTYVIEHNMDIIKAAIYRELARNGQVFYLHNRISDIINVAKKLNKMVPEAKICIGHGKMDRNDLEDVVSSFIDGKYNVMICTTIIETGIDIPNSNTLIVENAQRLGLAQMYQIRGRIGRSDRIAYAYFTYDTGKELNSTSSKRLDAIKEFTKIGSGYKIAVRDLAIRGAGDILGKEQSGFINSVGMDMYMKLLNEAVEKVKGIKEKEKINYHIEVSKYVEKEYVDDDTIIIYIHQRINQIDGPVDKQKTINELTDRFGSLSENILNYIEERYLESLLRKLNILKIREEKNMVTIVIPKEESSKLAGDKVFMMGYKMSERILFEYKESQFIFKITKKDKDRSWMYVITELLEKITKYVY